MVLSDSEQEFSLWQTQPEIQQLAAIVAAVKGKGRKKGGSANGGARNSPRRDDYPALGLSNFLLVN